MRIQIFVLVLIGLLGSALPGCSNAPARPNSNNWRSPSTDLSNAETEALTKAAQLMNWQDENRAKTWPGFQFSSTPTILHFSSGHLYAFDLDSTDPRWKKRVIEGRKVLFSETDFLGVGGVAVSPAFPLEGKLAFAFKLDLKENIIDRMLVVFLHERFHAYQFAAFAGLAEQGILKYSAHTNEENVALVGLENAILKKWVLSPSQETIKDYLAVFENRARLIGKESIAWEENQARMEGTAEYFSWMVSKKSKIVSPEELEFRRMADMEAYFSLSANGIDNIIKWRHYVAGGLLGEALVAYGPKGWQRRVEKGESLHAILRRVIPLNKSEREKRLARAMASYDFESIKEQVARTISEYRDQLARHRAEFETHPGTQLKIYFPTGKNCSGGYYAERSFYLPDGGRLDLGSTGSNQCGEFLRAAFKNVPHLITESAPASTTLKLPNDALLEIDGGAYSISQLREAKMLKFTRLLVGSTVLDLKSHSLPGSLALEGEMLVLRY